MTTHTCEWDLHKCSSSDCEIYEPCGAPAAAKIETLPNCWSWLCADHADFYEKHCSN
jgi:hypothetical protein